MKAAVISEFGQSPQYVDHAEPVPDGSSETLIEVSAAGLHHNPRTRRGHPLKAMPLNDVRCAWKQAPRCNERIVITSSRTPSVVFHQEEVQ